MTTLYDVVYELNRSVEAHEAVREATAEAYKRRDAAEKIFQKFVGSYVSSKLPAIVELGYKKFLLSFETASQTYQLTQLEEIHAMLIDDTPKVPSEPKDAEGTGT